jgi:hypothetical protein
MTRTLLGCALLFAWPLTAQAQKTVEPTETVIRLTVQPMAAPKPALKYQLLPELREMNQGNPVQEYMKCFAEQQNFFFDKAVLADRERHQVIPLSELPLKELRYYCGRGPLKEADYAARLDTPNWQILPRIKAEGVATLLPDIQQLRMLASALKVRFRVEVAEKRFDDALTTAKTMFALSRHLGEHPTLIANLVGMAIANVAIGPLEEMLQQPGCPNLYWALTDLPNPFISLRNGLQGERVILHTHIEGIEDRRAMTQQELDKLLARLGQTLKELQLVKADAKAWLQSRLENDKHIAAARQRLIESGLPDERVKAFLPLQVVLLDEKTKLEARLHDEMKLMTLPYWQVDGQFHSPRSSDDLSDQLLNMFAGAGKVRKAQARLEQRIALLRHVEAIRLYAAEHDGKLPATLNDIGLPLPVDPFTGEPFRYSVDGPLAEVRGSPPRGETTSAAYNVRYVVNLRK